MFVSHEKYSKTKKTNKKEQAMRRGLLELVAVSEAVVGPGLQQLVHDVEVAQGSGQVQGGRAVLLVEWWFILLGYFLGSFLLRGWWFSEAFRGL